MKILVIGGQGTIGKRVTAHLSSRHELLIAGRSGGDVQVDIASAASIESMFGKLGLIDACVCLAGTGYYGPFETMTEKDLL
jgi:nucleoside-diphosphate-sugar epimerase